MATPFITVTLDATSTTLLVRAGENVGPDGWLIQVASTSWSGSLVFKVNTAPPGSAASYTNVAYLTGGTWAAVAAGTAITALNNGAAGGTVDVAFSATTAFVEGEGQFELVIQKL